MQRIYSIFCAKGRAWKRNNIKIQVFTFTTVIEKVKTLPSQFRRGFYHTNSHFIQVVQIAADGSGLMKLSSTSKRVTGIDELYTKDYGQHWSLK